MYFWILKMYLVSVVLSASILSQYDTDYILYVFKKIVKLAYGNEKIIAFL